MPVIPNAPRRPRVIPLVIAAALSVGNLFLHKPISDVCDALFERVGRGRYEVITLVGIGLLSLAAALPSLRRLRHPLDDTWLAPALLGLAILTAASQRWLLVTNIELIHFPQFALIAVLFLAAGLGARQAWLCGSIAGLLDEAYQHLVLYAGVIGTYFDINDILLNAIGAAWGVCLFGAARLAAAGPVFDGPRRYAEGLGLLAVAVVVATAADPPNTTLLQRAATGRPYRVLSTGEGLAGIAAVAALIELASLNRRRAASPPGAIS
jgi:hypothetical protein